MYQDPILPVLRDPQIPTVFRIVTGGLHHGIPAAAVVTAPLDIGIDGIGIGRFLQRHRRGLLPGDLRDIVMVDVHGIQRPEAVHRRGNAGDIRQGDIGELTVLLRENIRHSLGSVGHPRHKEGCRAVQQRSLGEPALLTQLGMVLEIRAEDWLTKPVSCQR